jgi:hypothetical protein
MRSVVEAAERQGSADQRPEEPRRDGPLEEPPDSTADTGVDGGVDAPNEGTENDTDGNRD